MPILTLLPILTILAIGLLTASLVVLYLFAKELSGEDEEDD